MPRILLVHIPPFGTAQLDTFTYKVEAGFSGFRNVLDGWHRIQVNRFIGEVELHGADDSAALVPNVEAMLRAGDTEREQNATSGALDGELASVSEDHPELSLAWQQATGLVTLPRATEPPPLDGPGKRVMNFLAAYADERAALAALQTYFANACMDEPGAVEALTSLWHAFAHAGTAIEARPAFFAQAATTIAAALTVYTGLSDLAKTVQLDHLATDLEDDGGAVGKTAAAVLRAAMGE